MIATEASILYGAPDYDGMVQQFGLARDWRPSQLWRGYNCDYIEPLGAIGPVADARPKSMDASDWSITTNWNTSWVERYPALVDSVRCYQFTGVLNASTELPWTSMDSMFDTNGLLHANGTWCESILPRFALYIIRSMPPAGQGCPSQVNVQVPGVYNDDGTYKACVVGIYLPLAGDSSEDGKQFSSPFIHIMPVEDISGYGYSLFSDGQILATGGQASSMRQGSGREGWIVEYQDDSARFDGGHILIRQTDNPTVWWHFYDPRVYLSRKSDWDALAFTGYGGYYQWKIGASGAVQTVNLTPLLYGSAEAACWPEKAKPLPHEIATNEVEADAWYDTATVSHLVMESSGWTTTSAMHATERKPVTTFTPPASPVNRRPLLWFARESYTPQFTAAETDPRTDIDADEVMRSLVWTWGKDFKGSRGSATFSRRDTASYSAWEERASCLLRMGWNSEAGGSLVTQAISQAYITPGGMPRDRDGEQAMGAPGFGPVQFGAYDVAILQDKPLIDCSQAGGMTVEAWALMISGRLGIPAAKVYVATEVASNAIPVNAIPSKPYLAPGDGESAATHIAAVEQAADIRVCWNKTTSYVMWVDGGAPDYNPATSTISLDIDYDALVQYEIAFRLQHGFTQQRSANALKARYGSDTIFGGQLEYYWAQPLVQRAAYLKGDFWAYYEDPDASKADLIARYYKERRGGDGQLAWLMPLRVDLRPDMFVRVTDCPYMGITTNAVYQIEEHTANQLAAESELSAVRVYVDDDSLSLFATGGEFGGMHANLGLSAAATEGALGDYEGITGLPAVGTSGAFDVDGASDDLNDSATLGYLED